jgi:FRG domain
MAIYEGDDISITAIAQHYGIPTPFLDLTTDPEVAVLFAKSAADEAPSEAVIYCFLEAGLQSLKDARLTRINVDNLWRLEAQKGLFLQCLDESSTETIRSQAIRIYFPASPLTAAERTRLYPVRKSALESVIDQWIYRRQVEEITESFKDVRYKFMTHRETYPGAFRWRAVPEFEASWFEQESAWVYPPVESVSITSDPETVALRILDFDSPEKAKQELVAAIQGPICQYRATGQLISFVANLSVKKSYLSGSVSTLVNRCWDGLRVLPFRADEMIASISLIAMFLIARAEAVEGVDKWPKRFFGELKTIEIAPIGGHIEGGRVSKIDLRKALSGRHLAEMTAYMRRRAEADPEFAMLYIVDHWMLFEFQLFKKLFVEQFIPTAVDAYWEEDLASNEGALGGMWSINFNPALLGYVTPFEFRFHSPISGEKDCRQIIYVLSDMGQDDIEESFISCLPSILAKGAPFQVRFHGYSSDPRPIWEIERVVEQSKWIVEVGGISVLDVMPSATSEPKDEIDRAFLGAGAFEIWLISRGLVQQVQGKSFEDLKPIFDEFWAELMISNANIETRARSVHDWPGPVASP